MVVGRPPCSRVVVVIGRVVVVAAVLGGVVGGPWPFVGVDESVVEPGVTNPDEPLPPPLPGEAVGLGAGVRVAFAGSPEVAPFAASAAGNATARLSFPSRDLDGDAVGNRPRSARCNAGNDAEPVRPMTTSTTYAPTNPMPNRTKNLARAMRRPESSTNTGASAFSGDIGSGREVGTGLTLTRSPPETLMLPERSDYSA